MKLKYPTLSAQTFREVIIWHDLNALKGFIRAYLLVKSLFLVKSMDKLHYFLQEILAGTGVLYTASQGRVALPYHAHQS